jgi:hypothetical protein
METRKINKEGEEELLSHYRVIKNQFGQEFGVPVVDVRDGIAYRMMGQQMLKSNNRSKFMNYSRYNESQRKQKTI